MLTFGSASKFVHPYLRKKILLTTKHDKLKLIKPAFNLHLNCELEEICLDTDQFGSFAGEIERIAPPRETAIQKARLGMNATGAALGIASEGSIGPDPNIPFIHSNIEYLVLVDDENKLVISESYRSFDILVATITAVPKQDLSDFLLRADFPRHRLIVRPTSGEKNKLIKGIADLKELSDAINKISAISPLGSVVIESDLRAMHSPSRQKNIEEVAKLLAIRASRLCPACQMPGWGLIGYKKGLKCIECRTENVGAIRQKKLGCVKCEYSELGAIIAISLDPARCDRCNP